MRKQKDSDIDFHIGFIQEKLAILRLRFKLWMDESQVEALNFVFFLCLVDWNELIEKIGWENDIDGNYCNVDGGLGNF